MHFSIQTSICALMAVWLGQGHISLASTLFRGATIITYDTDSERTQVLRNASLLVENDRIAQLANDTTSIPTANADEVIDVSGKIISPGFINTHHHLWQTAFKTLGSNTTLAQYFQRYSEISPAIEYFTPEDKYLGQLAGALELLYTGVTTVLDHAHGDSSNETADATLNATIDSGIRAFYAYAVHELPNNYTVDDQIYKLESLADDARLNESSLVQLGLAYDNFWAAPASLVERLRGIVLSRNLSVVTTHYLGGPWISNNSPAVLHQYDMLNISTPVIFAHSSFIDAESVQLLRSTNQYISTTPESENHYGHDHPYSWLIQDQAALGVDTHFTFSTDMVGQARLWLQDLRLRQFSETLAQLEVPLNNPMSVEQAFHLITRAGALALRRDDIGVIREGAKADLVIFNGDSPNMLGWNDPIAAVILHSNTGDVSDVMVDGQFVKRNGSLLYEGYEDVKRQFLQSSQRIQSIWEGTNWAPLAGLWLNGSYFAETDTIDAQRGPGTGY